MILNIKQIEAKALRNKEGKKKKVKELPTGQALIDLAYNVFFKNHNAGM